MLMRCPAEPLASAGSYKVNEVMVPLMTTQVAEYFLPRLRFSEEEKQGPERHHVQTNNPQLSEWFREQVSEAARMIRTLKHDEQNHKPTQCAPGALLHLITEIRTFPSREASKGCWVTSATGNFRYLFISARPPKTISREQPGSGGDVTPHLTAARAAENAQMCYGPSLHWRPCTEHAEAAQHDRESCLLANNM